VLLTDGLPAYAYWVPSAQHGWCRLHHQQGVTHGLQQHFTTAEEIDARMPVMNKVLQTRDKRTVRRRLARVRERASELRITPWGRRVEAKWPELIGSVGSTRLPSTTNASARFFRAFERFDKTRQGVHSVLSAKRALRLVLVVSVFTPRDSTGQAPIEVIVPEARRMPLYRVINDPLGALQERAHVKAPATMADLLRPQEAVA
jgi:hypothetical protein